MANTGDNYGAVLEALNDKMDRDVENRHSGVETVVEHWHDENGNWYRVWSDGWIEQGGILPINTTSRSFNIPFVYEPLCIQVTIKSTGTDTYGGATATNTTISYVSFTNPPRYFYACGY